MERTMKILRNIKYNTVKYKGQLYTLQSRSSRNIGKAISNEYIDSEAKFEEVINSGFEKFEFSDIPDVPHTYAEYLSMSEKNMEEAIKSFERNRAIYSNLKEYLRSFISLEHELKPSEVEDYYETHLSIVINGHEFHSFLDEYDTDSAVIDRFYGYMLFNQSYIPSDVLDTIIPEKYRLDFPTLRLVAIENGVLFQRYSKYLFDKSYRCIDKLIFYRRYLDPSTIGTCQSKPPYTGREDKIEMDYYNLGEDLPPEMKWYIRNRIPFVDEAQKVRRMKYLKVLSRLSKENYAYGLSVDPNYGAPYVPSLNHEGRERFRGEFGKTEKYWLSMSSREYDFDLKKRVDIFIGNEPTDISDDECVVYDETLQDYVVLPRWRKEPPRFL